MAKEEDGEGVEAGNVGDKAETFPLGAVPGSVLAVILSHTTALDAAKLAAVNRTFAEAAKSDLVWSRFLPGDVDEIVHSAVGGSLVYGSLKGLYDRLADYVLLRDGNEGYWIERKTGGVCRSYSARAIRIIWGDTEDYWHWLPHEGSRFEKVAYLQNACWLELLGDIKCRLPPGTYTLSWTLKFNAESHGWHYAPVKFFFTDGITANLSDVTFSLSAESPCRQTSNGWLEYDVGQFVVEKGSNSNARNTGEVNLSFSMKETNMLIWKSGMYVDGVVIRPAL